MKSAIFASPNLKMIVAMATLVAVLPQVMGPCDRAEASFALDRPGTIQARELEQMVDQTFVKPTAENYEAVSGALLRNGDVRRALFYMRKATLAADLEQ
jgi:hypothetical protein